MKMPLVVVFLFLGLLSGCTSSERLERIQTEAPTHADIVGTYSIIEATASDLSLEQAKLTSTRLDIVADGTLRFSEFPIFTHPSGMRGIFTKINETGRWFITSDRYGYYVELIRDNGGGMRVIVAEGGNPSDLIVYYGPRENGYFIKLRKL